MDESLYSAIQPPLATADLPGVGGRLKLAPEDFEVEEIPAYEPCGSGEHLYLWLEKPGTVAEVVKRLREQGVPNFYGPQRFGRSGATLRIGLAMLRGEPPPVSEDGRRPNLFNPFLRKIALSSVQSAVFNLY